MAAATEWERIGDLLAAADAAAQAATAYLQRRLRGSATTAAARAHRFAESCDGARTRFALCWHRLGILPAPT